MCCTGLLCGSGPLFSMESPGIANVTFFIPSALQHLGCLCFCIRCSVLCHLSVDGWPPTLDGELLQNMDLIFLILSSLVSGTW